jgi:hypothetical protein
MAAKASASGELYFIGEKDPITGEDTQYLKIGIVRDQRATASRVKDHQTSNPRQLHAVEVIKTPIVDRLETTMHGKFAPMRLSGEWFYFSQNQRDVAIATAQNFAIQATENVIHMERAEKFGSVASVENVLTPSSDLVEIHRTLIGLREKIRTCKSLSELILNALKDADKAGVDVKKMLTVQDKKGSEKFDTDLFKVQHPELWKQFVSFDKSWKGSFLVTDPASQRPDAFSLFPELADLNGRIEEMVHAGHDHSADLHHLFLETLSLQSPAEWEKDLLEDLIKSECAENSAIDGVCKWSRSEVEKENFDKKGLKAAFPDVFAEFVSVGENTKPTFLVKDLGFEVS